MAIVLPKFPRRRLSSGLAAETQPAVNVTLCREDACYEAGGMLAARWRISRIPLERLLSLEMSVMWHTEGKGDEDLHVHHFQRLRDTQLRRAGMSDDQWLRCQLPATPLSYRGKLITIRWCIRLRLFMSNGREIVAEQPFYLVAPGSRHSAHGTWSTRHGLVCGEPPASEPALLPNELVSVADDRPTPQLNSRG